MPAPSPFAALPRMPKNEMRSFGLKIKRLNKDICGKSTNSLESSVIFISLCTIAAKADSFSLPSSFLSAITAIAAVAIPISIGALGVFHYKEKKLKKEKKQAISAHRNRIRTFRDARLQMK